MEASLTRDFVIANEVKGDTLLESSYRAGAASAAHAITHRLMEMHKGGELDSASANIALTHLVEISLQIGKRDV